MKSANILRRELCDTLRDPNFNENEFNKRYHLESVYAYRRKTLENADFDVEVLWRDKDADGRLLACWHRYSTLGFLPQFVHALQRVGFELDVVARNVTSKSIYPVLSDPVCRATKERYDQLCREVCQEGRDTNFRLLRLHLYRCVKNKNRDLSGESRKLQVCLEWQDVRSLRRFMCWHTHDSVCEMPVFVQRAKELGFDASRILREAPNNLVYNIVVDPLCMPPRKCSEGQQVVENT